MDDECAGIARRESLSVQDKHRLEAEGLTTVKLISGLSEMLYISFMAVPNDQVLRLATVYV